MARASGAISALSVQVSATDAMTAGQMTVLALHGAAGVGSTATQQTGGSSCCVTLTPAATGSWILGTANDVSNSYIRQPDSGNGAASAGAASGSDKPLVPTARWCHIWDLACLAVGQRWERRIQLRRHRDQGNSYEPMTTTNFFYDAFGQPVDLTTSAYNGTSQPDNNTGKFDYGWLGQNQKGTDHSGVLDLMQMGARVYCRRWADSSKPTPSPAAAAIYDYAAKTRSTARFGAERRTGTLRWPAANGGECIKHERDISRNGCCHEILLTDVAPLCATSKKTRHTE